MPRIMGLDVGGATIGVAISDPLGLTARPVTTIRRSGFRRDLQALSKLAAEHEIMRIVVGLPLRLDGNAGPAAAEMLTFVEKLGKGVRIPIETWDERFSTVQAERALLEADMRRSRRREVINHVAASIMLQSYLDANPRGDP